MTPYERLLLPHFTSVKQPQIVSLLVAARRCFNSERAEESHTGCGVNFEAKPDVSCTVKELEEAYAAFGSPYAHEQHLR